MFKKRIIGELDNAALGGDMNTLFTVGDVYGDGWTDIVVGGRSGMLAWFENPGERGGEWTRHIVDQVHHYECGGVVHDLTGNGLGDIINGGDWQRHELSWWENPGAGGGPWVRRNIASMGGTQFHDEAIGDVTGDGRLSLVFWNQGTGTLAYAPLPADPRQSPWPGIQAIATGMQEQGQPEEGMVIADIDGDGVNEIVAGTRWYKHLGGGRWEQHQYARGYITTVITVADVDGDGRPEIVLSEGDPCIYGHPEGGKLGWFKPGADMSALWEEHRVDEGLLDAHSLQAGDILGHGRADLLVGEIGVKERYEERPPRLMVYENDGRGGFTRRVIDEGTGSHHARLVDLRKRGMPDIASRPLHGPDRWKVIIWENER